MNPIHLCCLLATTLVSSTEAQGLGRRVTKRVQCNDVEKAENGDVVSIHYTGKLASNGNVFDSSEGKDPISFELGKGIVIPGWEQGLLGSCPGEGLELTIPPELGYGEQGAGDVIPPNAELVFTLTVEEIKKSLKIETLKEGNCQGRKKRVRGRDRILVHYRFTLADGTLVDDSHERDPLEMTVDSVGIKGWDDGVKGACEGEVRRVVVPPHLGYGDKGIEGQVPPGATIILEMEIVKVQDRVLSFLDQISSGTFAG